MARSTTRPSGNPSTQSLYPFQSLYPLLGVGSQQAPRLPTINKVPYSRPFWIFTIFWRLSGFKVLVQHQYPGHSRNEGVAHGTIPTLESHGARRIESYVGDGRE